MHHHPGSHDPVLVALSVLIAALSSYTALDLATRMRAASGSASLGWLGAAAVAMGGGIWSMHFVAMLAFSLPGVDISYDPLLTLLSLAIPILVAAAAFVVVSRRSNALRRFRHWNGARDFRHALHRHERHADGGFHPLRSPLGRPFHRHCDRSVHHSAAPRFSHDERARAHIGGSRHGVAISGMHYAAMQGSSFVPADAVLAAQHTAWWDKRPSRS